MNKVKVFTKEMNSANILDITVGTNCPQGGDAGHGGRTVFRLSNAAATAMSLKYNDVEIGQVEDIEIILSGDTECDTFIQALEFALESLKSQVRCNGASGIAEID